jgi:hypothetical protein
MAERQFSVLEDLPGRRLTLLRRGASRLWWARFSWDAEAGRFSVVRSRWLLWERRELEIPFGSLLALGFSAVGAGGALPVTFRLRHREDGRDRRRVFLFPIEGLDQRAEVLDLAFRVAAIVGWREYALQKNDERGLDLVLLRGEAAEVGAGPYRARQSSRPSYLRAVPAPDAPAGYERDAAVARFSAPGFWPPTIAEARRAERTGAVGRPLELAALLDAGTAFSIYRAGPLDIREWEPGLRVRLSGEEDAEPFEGREGLAREVLLDWSTRLATFRRDTRSLVVELRAIRRLVVRGERREGDCQCHIQARVLSSYEELLSFGASPEDPDSPRSAAMSLAEPLAAALGVPCLWEGYGGAR